LIRSTAAPPLAIILRHPKNVELDVLFNHPYSASPTEVLPLCDLLSWPSFSSFSHCVYRHP
jgi:hypothetical protein